MSLNEAYSSLVGSLAKGDKLLKSKKEVEGCFKAAERKAWSVRRKETLFNGDPRQVSARVCVAVIRERTREVIRDFFAEFLRQHRVNFSMCRLRQLRLRHCGDHY